MTKINPGQVWRSTRTNTLRRIESIHEYDITLSDVRCKHLTITIGVNDFVDVYVLHSENEEGK